MAAFGPEIVDRDDRIDRAALARVAFGDPAQLAALTAVSHPAINAELVARLDGLPGDSIVILDMAILAESNLGSAAIRPTATSSSSRSRRLSRCVSSAPCGGGWMLTMPGAGPAPRPAKSNGAPWPTP